jgi:hypothetical protein
LFSRYHLPRDPQLLRHVLQLEWHQYLHLKRLEQLQARVLLHSSLLSLLSAVSGLAMSQLVSLWFLRCSEPSWYYSEIALVKFWWIWPLC